MPSVAQSHPDDFPDIETVTPPGALRHNGGECPVDLLSYPHVFYRDGRNGVSFRADQLDWGHIDDEGDIVAYIPPVTPDA